MKATSVGLPIASRWSIEATEIMFASRPLIPFTTYGSSFMRISSPFSAGRGMREAVATTKANMTTTFVRDIADVDLDDVRSFGGKATGLAKMAGIGIPIPPAFVVGPNGFHHFRSKGGRVDTDLMNEVDRALRRLERSSGKTFAGAEQPLLISVRSGAAISMPGMMDTILNLGLDARSALRLAQTTGK